jgi:shikimate dehydrogenase
MIESSGLTLYGIIGHPVGHSLSPIMHNASFEALGIHATMQAYDIEPESLKDALESFGSLGFGGINVTIPHKQAIIPLLDFIDEEAGFIGAVNTVKFEGGKLQGFNTDSFGFLQTLEPLRSSIEGSRFVVLGAGGAARAVTYVLLRFFRTSQIIVAARTSSGSRALVEHFKGFHGTKLATATLDDPHLARIMHDSEVIINATPVGMHPTTGQMVVGKAEFREGQTVIDLVYRPLETELLRQAKQKGARTVSGLEMFIHQGARAFEIWTGRGMDIERIRRLLTQRLQRDGAGGEDQL